MHYKAKHVPRDGYVADADALMREFNRAERAAGEIDQSNLKDVGVLYTHAAKPSGTASGTTFTHNGGSSLLLVDPNSGSSEAMTLITTGVVTTREDWLPIFDGAGSGTPVALTFTLTTATPMLLIGQVEWTVPAGTSAAYRGMRLRMLLDGVPSEATTTVHAEQQSGAVTHWSGYVQQLSLLQAGDHRVELQGADMRDGDAEVASVFRRTILGMGFPR